MKGKHIESENGSELPKKNVKISPEHAGIGPGKPKFS